MNVKIFITIDTEEDTWGVYKKRNNPVENVHRLPLLQKLFDSYEVIPTYLVDYAVIIDKEARNILKKIHNSGKCEIGTHCHPWNTPPFEEENNNYNSMLCNLTYKLQFKKIKTLHNAISEYFGEEPICFRAGRWAFSIETALCLHELGYKVDTSISPFIVWSNINGPNFSLKANPALYRFDPDDIFAEKRAGSLLEVPPTIGFFQNNFERCASIRELIMQSSLSRLHLLGILDRLKIINFRWLSPEISDASDMISLAKTFIQKGYPFLNMSFHSTSLLPGCSPFVSNDDEYKKLIENIEQFIKFAANNGLEFSPLSDSLEL